MSLPREKVVVFGRTVEMQHLIRLLPFTNWLVANGPPPYTVAVRRPFITLIFFLSGAAGLVFEVVWARQLVLVFGNTSQSVSAILTGFFGGMALGNWLGGIAADRVARPLRLYGLTEIGITIVVLATPLSFGAINAIYRTTFQSLPGGTHWMEVIRYFLALLALAPATILMGSTFPTLTRYLAARADDLGPAFTRLYAANTMGAVFGAAITGILLIEIFGLRGALIIGASGSAIAGVAALVMSRADVIASPVRPRPPGNNEVSRTPLTANQWTALVFAFSSGLTALGYQVTWMRLIASGTGSSTYVFTLVLTLFLVGLAFGALEYERRSSQTWNVVGVLAAAQIALSIVALLGMYAINAMDALPGGFLWKTLVVVLPATAVMGFTFPAASSLVGDLDSRVGTASGRVLAMNTLGAILGASVVPFVFIPAFGSPGTIAALAVTSAITGVWLATRMTTGGRRLSTAVAGLGAIGTTICLFIWSDLFLDPEIFRLRAEGGTLSRSAEDHIASVQSGTLAGRKQLWVSGFSMTVLTVDAKLMAVLPLMLRPASQSSLVIAFGMGSSYRASLVAGVATDAVELVPSVPKMFDVFYSDAPAVMADPRGRVIVEDGRSYLELTEKLYDIIVVDPPPPLQSSGVSIISSREFYLAARRHLTPGGVMMQWVPRSQTLAEFKDHVRTFASVFANVIIAHGPAELGYYMLGSQDRIQLKGHEIRSVLSRPGVVADLSSAEDSPAHSLEGWAALIPGLVLLTGADVNEFAGRGPLITDDRPRPEYFLLRDWRSKPQPWLRSRDVRVIDTTRRW